MIAKLVSFALQQRFLIVIASLALMLWGAVSFQKLPIDAYPDLSPTHVEIITQWPGHAAEEIERLVTIPIEIEMNGIPKLDSLRSISLYGLSSVQMNFEYGADPYFVREQAFERVGNASLPSGLQPSLSPLFSPSGLIYRYVLQSTDRTPQDLKVIEDWVVERRYRSIQGVADDSGFGGTTMQYEVLLDPNKLFSYGLSVPQVSQQLSNNNANAGGGFYSQGGQFYYIRGLGLVKDTADIGNIILQQKGHIPVYVKDVAKVEIGHAPRLGQFGYMKQDEAVEGVILMRVGEQAQVILRKVEAMTKELNEHVLPPDVKVVPYYDRQSLIEETTKTVENNLLTGMLLVLVILGVFLFSVRTALRSEEHTSELQSRRDLHSCPARRSSDLPDRRNHQNRAKESADRHAAGAGDSGRLPVQRAHRADRGHHHPICADVLFHLPGLAPYPRQPALHRRHRFRHHRGWRGGHGGEHLPRTLGAARGRNLARGGCHPRRRARCRAAHLLFGRRDHRRLSPHLRPHRTVRAFVPAHGGYHDLRPVRVAAVRADAFARALLLFPAQARSRTAPGAL